MEKDTRPINVGMGDIISMMFSWPITALTSITHRIAGAVLFVGIGFALYALELSLAGEDGFAQLQSMLSSPLGKFVIWGLLAALAYHFVAGVKHLITDGQGKSLASGVFAARVTLLFSAILIVLAGFWVI